MKLNKLALCASLLPSMAHAQVSLTDVENLAKERNPILLAAKRELQATVAETRQWLSPFLPMLDLLGFVGLRDGETRDMGTGVGLVDKSGAGVGASLSWLLFAGGQESTVRHLAFQQVKSALLTESIAWLDLQLEVRTEFSTAARIQDEIASAKSAVDSATEVERLAKEMVEQGKAPQSYLLSATAEKLKRMRELGELEADLQGALARLVACCNADIVGGKVGEWNVPLDLPETLEAALAAAETHNQDVLTAELQVSLQKLRLNEVIQSGNPSLRLFADADSVSNPMAPKSTGASAGIALTIPILDGGLRASKRAELRNLVKQAEAQRDVIWNRVRAEVTAWWAKFATSALSIKAAQAEIEAAAESLRITVLRFQEGRDTQATVAFGRSALLEAESSLARAREYQRQSWSHLRRMLGG